MTAPDPDELGIGVEFEEVEEIDPSLISPHLVTEFRERFVDKGATGECRTVWVAPLARAFHTHDCEFAGEPLSAVSRDAAVERGLEPCPVCEP